MSEAEPFPGLETVVQIFGWASTTGVDLQKPGIAGEAGRVLLVVFSDSDDAGCTATRKSTSCGCMMHGDHLIQFYSSTQHVIALSSGESEFYAGIKAGSTLLGGVSTMLDLGISLNAELRFHATAAKAMLSRRGFGKAKRISRCHLWLQQRIADGEITLTKVGTARNPADLGTKHLDRQKIVALQA